MKKRFVLTIAFVLGLGMLAGCGKKVESTEADAGKTEAQVVSPAEETVEPEEETPAEFAGDELHHVEMEVENYGTILLELDATVAPITVENFLSLAKSGFYDGLTFHRIMDGFMIQGGDPLGNGTGGSDQTIKGEFASNGVENPISHEEGVISMARAQDPDSASSQFFIVVDDSEFLDGDYAAFGWVTSGQDIVEQIAKDAKPVDNNGTILPEEQPVIVRMTVID